MRQRAFAGIDEQHDAVHHLQCAFDFAAEIAVAGRVHDVDLHAVIKERGVLREDGDAALALEFVGIHDALDVSFVGAEGAALVEHGVHEGGLAVVHVGDDGDVANAGSQRMVFPERGISSTLLRADAVKGADKVLADEIVTRNSFPPNGRLVPFT